MHELNVTNRSSSWWHKDNNNMCLYTSEEKGNTDRAEAAADCSYDTGGEKRSYAALLEWLY